MSDVNDWLLAFETEEDKQDMHWSLFFIPHAYREENNGN